MGKPILEIKNLEKVYNETTHALQGMNVSFHEGEFVVIIGPSGAGKSTFIRCINRMIDPSQGDIVFDGIHMEKMRGKSLRKQRSMIGMIFQHYNLIGRTNVIKNVLHGRLGHMSLMNSLCGRFSKEDIQEAATLLKQVGLDEQMYKRADELSGGQMQRVGICRAIIQHPKLLLADEPIASLDPHSANKVMDTLYKMTCERGLTCIVNLHQVDFAKKYATRIIGIKAGRIVYDGTPNDLTDEMIQNIYQGKEEQIVLKQSHQSVFLKEGMANG